MPSNLAGSNPLGYSHDWSSKPSPTIFTRVACELTGTAGLSAALAVGENEMMVRTRQTMALLRIGRCSEYAREDGFMQSVVTGQLRTASGRYRSGPRASGVPCCAPAARPSTPLSQVKKVVDRTRMLRYCWVHGNQLTVQTPRRKAMQTIYKYPLLILDEQELEMPMGAGLMTVQMQRGQPCLWVLVDTRNTMEKRKVLIRGTGHPATDVGRYIATFQMKGGELVFHAFEPLPSSPTL
jgi:hypothetical protein